jgi:hypothetical protein
MSIAVNANKRPSPFGGAEGGLRFTSQASFRSSERRRRIAITNYRHVAPNEAKTDR